MILDLFVMAEWLKIGENGWAGGGKRGLEKDVSQIVIFDDLVGLVQFLLHADGKREDSSVRGKKGARGSPCD